MKKYLGLLASILLVNIVLATTITPSMKALPEDDTSVNSGMGSNDFPAGLNKPTVEARNQKSESKRAGNGENTNQENHSKHAKVDESATLAALDSDVFGANLFDKECANFPEMDSFNPGYLVSQGDQVNVQMWGAFTFTNALTVDTQGNIFIPEVGPVHLSGVTNKDLNQVISDKVKTVFKKNVNVYANLMTAQPVQVFVTGYVNKPGLYDGTSSDSILYYMCKAEGINTKQGSFRDIVVMRDDKVYKKVDLYKFLVDGRIPLFQLHQGDVVDVQPIENTVKVEGEVNHPYQYEFSENKIHLSTLMKMASPKSDATYAEIATAFGRHPTVHYVPVSELKHRIVHAGDKINLISDQSANEITVAVRGAIAGKHEFILPKGATMQQLIDKIKLTHQSNINNLQLFRPSVAEEQKAAIDSSLDSMQRELLTGSDVTAEGASIRAQEAKLMEQFVAKARDAKPQGQVVVGQRASWKDVTLEDKDVINIPAQSSVVLVTGQVMASRSLVLRKGESADGYIKDDGGYADNADTSHVIILHEDGEVDRIPRGMFARSPQIRGGDQIVVPPKAQSQTLQKSGVLTKIAYEVAVASKVALTL